MFKKKESKESISERAFCQKDYKTLFIKESGGIARNGKVVYIPEQVHQAIQAICHVIGKNEITLSDYIKNVFVHHFDTYGDEITRLYDESHKGINILKKSGK